jgi:predicted RNA-binding Zn-ribbon protein involved in translation (DUF1610 family)
MSSQGRWSVIVSISNVEALIHKNENMCIDKKNFLMCGSCFWCVSLTGNRTILSCPSCGNNEIQPMRISDYASYNLDHDYINEMVSAIVDKLR